jgi:uncharacterized membrane protein
MAKLVALSYVDDPDGALNAARELEDLPFAENADLDDAVAVVTNRAGEPKLLQSTNLTAVGALDGALIGLASAVVLTFMAPVLPGLAVAGAALGGSAIGALTGGVIGHYSDIGVDDAFVREIAEKLPPNSSALFVMLEDEQADGALAQLASTGGQLLVTTLPDEQAVQLRQALRAERGKEAL